MSTVYFVRAGGRVKIGFTGDLPARLLALQTGCPEKMTLLAVIHDCAPEVEKQLHAFFKPLRQQGEWFAANGGLLEFIGCVRGGAQPRTPQAIEHLYYFAIHPSRKDAARRVIGRPDASHDELRAAHILLRRLCKAPKLHFDS